MPPFTFFDHTGDIGVDVASPTLEGIFSTAGLALFEAIADTSRVEPRVTKLLRVTGEDLADTLNRFLQELLVIFDEERLLLPHVAVHEVGEREVAATAGGEKYDPERHEGRTELKAVTWHELAVTRGAAGWTARVVFDV